MKLNKENLHDLPIQIFLKQQHPIMPSSASSLVRLVYYYTRKDKVGGIWGTAQYHSRENSLQLQPPQLPLYLFHVFCVYIVSEECSRCFTGSHEVKSQRRCQMFMRKMWWKRALSLFGWGHLSCLGSRSKWQDFSLHVISASVLISSKMNKETLNWWNTKPNVSKYQLMFL